MANIFFPWNNKYPYVNDEELNLDWILKTLQKAIKDINDFIGINTIKYADPILWDITRQYEANTIVVDSHSGNAFISTKAVPSGVHLNNSDYWTQIYNYADVVDTLREQIAYNEGESTTATRAYRPDDLVFTNGLLFRVIAPMIAGDSFVIDSNIVKTTINDELLRIVVSINGLEELLEAEAVARGEADDTLQQHIEDEAAARTEADDTLQEHIEDEADAREAADADIIEMIDNIDVNHVYNQSTPDSGLTTNIGLQEGAYNITADTTINAQLVIPKGATINISPNITLTINGQILAGRYQIFNGTGNVVVNKAYQDFGYPEWFGNDNQAVQKCVATFSKTILAAKTYSVSGDLILDRNNMQLIGEGYGSAYASSQPSHLVFSNNGKLIVGNYQSNIIEDFPRNITVAKLMITGTASTSIISVHGVVRGLFEDLYLDTGTAYDGIAVYRSISTYFNRCYIQCLPANAHAFYGIRLYDVYDHTVGGRPASNWFNNCTVSDDRAANHEYSYGFFASGNQSDIYVDGCEFLKVSTGVYLEVGTTVWANVRITKCVLDSCIHHGLELKGNYADSLTTFSDNYIALAADSTDSCVYIQGTSPININGLECFGTNYAQIAIQSSVDAPYIIGNGIFRNMENPIVITNTNNVDFDYLLDGVLSTAKQVSLSTYQTIEPNSLATAFTAPKDGYVYINGGTAADTGINVYLYGSNDNNFVLCQTKANLGYNSMYVKKGAKIVVQNSGVPTGAWVRYLSIQ